MTGDKVPSRAIDLIIRRGVRFRLPAPFWRRWLGHDYVTIQPPLPGTVMMIAQEIIDYGLEFALLTADTPTPKEVEGVKRVVAVAILEQKAHDEKQLEQMIKRLGRIAWVSLLDIYRRVDEMLETEAFQRTTVSLAMKTSEMMRVKKKDGR